MPILASFSVTSRNQNNKLKNFFFSVSRISFWLHRDAYSRSYHPRIKRFVQSPSNYGGIPLHLERNVQTVATTCPPQRCGGICGSIFRASRVLYFIGPQKRYSAREAVDFASEVSMRNENIFSDGGLDGSINWNLLGDPSGGLNDGESAEELSEHDLMLEVKARQTGYVPEQFYLLFTPLIDIISILFDHSLLPENDRRKASRLRIQRDHAIQLQSAQHSAALAGATENVKDDASIEYSEDQLDEEQETGPKDDPILSIPVQVRNTGRRALDAGNKVVSHWFLDGHSALAMPNWTAEKMGPDRYAVFSAALQKYYTPIEAVMPLTRVVRQHGLPEHLFVPFLRQLSLDMHSVEHRAATVKVVPGIIITLANGRVVPKELGLPEDDEQRVMLVTALFLAVAHETGNTDLAYLAIQLLRAHGLPVPFSFQKQLTNVFSTASRVQTDWKVRSSGVLAECLPKWKEYLKKVRSEIRSGWRASQKRSAEEREEDSDSDMSRAPSFDTETRYREGFSKINSSGMAPSSALSAEKSKKRKGKKSSDKIPSESYMGVSTNPKGEHEGKNDSSVNDVAQYFTSDHLSSGGSDISRQLEANIRASVDERIQLWACTTDSKDNKKDPSANDVDEDALDSSSSDNRKVKELTGKNTKVKEDKSELRGKKRKKSQK